MALLTEAEQKKLREQGLWVREKCDTCGKPIIGTVFTVRGKPGVQCALCRTGKDLTQANLLEETRMAKAQKAEKAERKESKKVGGHLNAGTAIADLYLFLEDGKKHKLTDARKIAQKHKKELLDRLGNLRRVGQKKGAWGILIDEEAGTVQLKLGKPSGAAVVKKVAKAEKEEPKKKEAKSSGKGNSSAEPSGNSSKALRAVATLVRKTLKAGGEWTRNKLVEHLNDEHDIEGKRIQAAITEEIKAGGLTEEDGVLQLAS